METFDPKDKRYLHAKDRSSLKQNKTPKGLVFIKSKCFNYYLGFLTGAEVAEAGLYANSLSGTSQ